MLIWTIILVVGVLKGSTPTAYFWDYTIKNGHSVHKRALGCVMSGINVLTDLIVLLLPIPWLARLMNMTLRKKVALVVVFLTGGL